MYFNTFQQYICNGLFLKINRLAKGHITLSKIVLTILGALLFSGDADTDQLIEEMERAKYDAEMKAVAEQEAAKAQTSANEQPEKTGIEKRIREGKDDKVFKVSAIFF